MASFHIIKWNWTKTDTWEECHGLTGRNGSDASARQKKCQGLQKPPEAARGQARFSPRAFRGNMALLTP